MEAPLRNRRRDFTILELLFVVAIISLLAAILVPLLDMSRNKAKKTQCSSNLLQISMSIKLYADEYHYYPYTRRKAGAATYYWCYYNDGAESKFDKSPIYEYLKSSNVLLCPAFHSGFKSISPGLEMACSYGYNAEYVGGSPELNPAPPPEADIEELLLKTAPAKLIDIKAPDRTMLMTDSAFESAEGLEESYYFWARYVFSQPAVEHKARAHFRHRKMAVASFCDGHIDDSLKPDAIDNAEKRLGWPDQSACERH